MAGKHSWMPDDSYDFAPGGDGPPFYPHPKRGSGRGGGRGRGRGGGGGRGGGQFQGMSGKDIGLFFRDKARKKQEDALLNSGHLNVDFQKKVKKMLSDFQCSRDLELDFGMGLNNHERAAIHMAARKMDMVSKSTGNGDKRHLVVTRNKARPVDTVKRETEATQLLDEQKDAIQHVLGLHPIAERDIERHVHVAGEAQHHHKKPRDFYASKAGPKMPPPGNPGNAMIKSRKELPAYKFRTEVLDAIEGSMVTLVTGGTGCGKTTQVPQFLLERALETSTPLRVICTQPRRLPAIAVADRVSRERGEVTGSTVGYHIRLEQKTSAQTVLTYCTSGILLRMLTADELASEFTHIILDEVHEREMNTDYLLIALRQALKKRKDLKVILMSATMEGNLKMFMDYFHGSNIQHVNIPSRLFSVDNLMLSEVIALTGYEPPPPDENDAWRKKGNMSGRPNRSTPPPPPKPLNSVPKKEIKEECDDVMDIDDDGDMDEEAYFAQMQMLDSRPGQIGGQAEQSPYAPSARSRAADPVGGISAATSGVWKQPGIPGRPAFFNEGVVALAKKANLDHAGIASMYLTCGGAQWGEGIDHDLVLATIKYIMGSSVDGAILVFLPGYDDIQTMRERIQDTRWTGSSPLICMLHSQLNTADQQKVFDPAPRGTRKVILSTNIAEASLTIDDVVFVVDCGKAKETTYDHFTRISQLKVVWIAKSNAEQRSGRAGRCRPGFCFRLYSYEDHEAMAMSQAAEMQRSAIHDVCLHAKMFAPEGMSVKEFLALAPEPPAADAIADSLRFLEQLGALYTEGGARPAGIPLAKCAEPQLTQLGRLIAHLPLDPPLARLLLFGYSLRCFAPIVTLVALLSNRDPFTIAGPDEKAAANAVRDDFARRDFSDHAMMLRAFDEWAKVGGGPNAQASWCRQRFIAPAAMKMIHGIRLQLLQEMKRLHFIDDVHRALDDPMLNEYSGRWPMIQAAIVAGSHPCIGYAKPPRNKLFKVKTSTDGTAQLHPASSLRRQAMAAHKQAPHMQQYYQGSPKIEYLAFQEHVKIESGLTIRTASCVPSATVALFAGPIRLPKERLLRFCPAAAPKPDGWMPSENEDEPMQTEDDEFDLEDWLTIWGPREDLVSLMQLRFKVMDHFLKVLQKPDHIFDNESQHLLSALAFVLESEHRNKGFNEALDFGPHSSSSAAPQRPSDAEDNWRTGMGRGGGGDRDRGDGDRRGRGRGRGEWGRGRGADGRRSPMEQREERHPLSRDVGGGPRGEYGRPSTSRHTYSQESESMTQFTSLLQGMARRSGDDIPSLASYGRPPQGTGGQFADAFGGRFADDRRDGQRNGQWGGGGGDRDPHEEPWRSGGSFPSRHSGGGGERIDESWRNGGGSWTNSGRHRGRGRRY